MISCYLYYDINQLLIIHLRYSYHHSINYIYDINLVLYYHSNISYNIKYSYIRLNHYKTYSLLNIINISLNIIKVTTHLAHQI